MTASGSKSLPTLGFLTVVEHAELGWTGGYLVLNLLGRPLEFHCTAPVKPNRAQEILYGPTLKAFLFGEQIGQTLLEKSHFQPLFICTDVEPVLAVRETTSLPVALLVSPQSDSVSGASDRPEHSLSRPGIGTSAIGATDERTFQSDRTGPAEGGEPFESGRPGPGPLTCHGGRQLVVSPRHPEDVRRMHELWQDAWSEWDLSEPFERIRDAIGEAQKAA